MNARCAGYSPYETNKTAKPRVISHLLIKSSVPAAGFGLVSIFNVFLILVLGVADEEIKAAPQEPMRSAYSGSMSAPLA